MEQKGLFSEIHLNALIVFPLQITLGLHFSYSIGGFEAVSGARKGRWELGLVTASILVAPLSSPAFCQLLLPLVLSFTKVSAWFYGAWKTSRKIALWSVALPHPVASGLNPTFTPGREGKTSPLVCVARLHQLHSWRGRKKTWFCQRGFLERMEAAGVCWMFRNSWWCPWQMGVRDLSAGTWWRVGWQITSI